MPAVYQLVAADWTIGSNGDIRYIGDDHTGSDPSYATVDEMHRWVQGLADDEAYSGDDQHDITSPTASERKTSTYAILKTPYNIDDNAAEHIYDGSIEQDGGDTIYDGFVNFGNAAVIQIIQNGAVLSDDWWNENGGLNPDATQGISHRFMLKTRADGVDIDQRRIRGISREFGNTYSEFSVNGTSRGNNVLALSEVNDINNNTAAGTVSGWTDITNTEGLRLIDIDNDATDEEYYSEWDRGSRTVNQMYERLKWVTRQGTAQTIYGMNGELFRGVTHSFAYDGESGGSPATNDMYVWGTAIAYDNEASGPFEVGEAIHEDTATPVWKGRILAVDDNGTTGTLIVDVESGTVTDNDSFTGQTSGATADASGTPTAVTGGGALHLLAVDDDGTTGNLYCQLMKGSAPDDDVVLYDDTDVAQTLTVNGSVTARTISQPFCGQSTGTAIIGAYGFGMQAADTAAADQFTDLSGASISPPNQVTFTLLGLVSGEDYCLVTKDDGSGGIDFDQYTLNGALTGASVSSVVVNGSIDTDTPTTAAASTVRILRASGVYSRHPYDSWSGSTFTLTSAADFSSDNAANGANLFVGYIDKLAGSTQESFTVVFDASLGLFCRVRDGGGTPIKTFETTATLGSGGGSATVIRTSDA